MGEALAGVDLRAVEAWMVRTGLGKGPIEKAEPLLGGTQNVMARIVQEGREYVLRRGPLHPRAGSNASILREQRVLRALAGTAVPHPRWIAGCDDPEILDGAVFYLMEPVDGFNAGIELPAPFAEDGALRRQMGLSMIDALAELGAVDHVEVGLADFGKPEGFLERQVPRWRRELESYRSLGGGDGLPGIAEIGRWLERKRPAEYVPGIMHGDYHSANVLFSRETSTVAAIIDWEMCTIGAPLLDLGWLLATWRLPGAPGVFGGPFLRSDGLAAPADLTERYARRSGRDLSELAWYTVLACYKLAIILEGTDVRARAGLADPRTGAELHTTSLLLVDRAHALMNGES
jgi:aminoglycoside phosphotransferase (APT) family kinase protein